MLISPGNTLKDTPRITFDQISGYTLGRVAGYKCSDGLKWQQLAPLFNDTPHSRSAGHTLMPTKRVLTDVSISTSDAESWKEHYFHPFHNKEELLGVWRG